MALLTAQNLSLAFGWRPLLQEVSFSLEAGERVALLGRNGEGKSTLLNVIRGAQVPDEGVVQVADGVSVAYLPQDPPTITGVTVRAVVEGGLQSVVDDLARYQALMADFRDEDGQELAALEARINANEGWQLQSRVEDLLRRFELEGEQPIESLSGGWKRRVWLARVLVSRPQVLLLDEPTNHLDLSAIAWLEGVLNEFAGAVIFVTHDRAFMQNVANRIWSLDRGELLDVKSTYQRFLQTQAELLHAQALAQAKFDKKLAEEEKWIRQGIKARRTRNEGRVRALKEMRKAHAARLAQQGKAVLRLDGGERSGKLVIVAEGVSFAHEGAVHLIKDFNAIIERGEKIGLIGANGVGKTTLLNVLLGKIPPQEGQVKHGTKLEIAYFDQLRAALDESQTLRENLGEGKDYVEINGQRKHVVAYLQDFLFPPERWQTPVSALSGGERARLLLAKLFARPANVLVLDEPTNDLDVETLELLEEVLLEYQGTVLIVSHDRQFLDAIVTRSWVFNQALGKIEEVVGGFEDWINQGGAIEQLEAPKAQVEKIKEEKPAVKEKSPTKSVKLSYKHQRELEQLPAKIEQAEQVLERLTLVIQDEAFYQREHTEQAQALAELEQAQAQLDELLMRWMELEEGAD